MELKPCPFCGAKKPVTVRIYKGQDGWRDRYAVLCRYDEGGCGAESGLYHYESEAVEAWNRRAIRWRKVNLTDFEKLREICKFYHPAFDIDHNYIDTCRMPEMKPTGASLGDCNERECPFVAKDNRGVKHDAI